MNLEKQELRKLVHTRLKALDPEEIACQSRVVCEKVAALSCYKKAQTLLAYMAMDRECDPSYLVKNAVLQGKRVAFPLCVSDHELALYVPEPGAFNVGKYGIWEPDPARSHKVEPEELDLLIVPGVAFDASCARMGHGAGYYDRLLSHSHGPRVGLALEEQMVDRVPVEEFDVPMDYVISPNCKYWNGL